MAHYYDVVGVCIPYAVQSNGVKGYARGIEECIAYGACSAALRRGSIELVLNHGRTPIASQVDGSLYLSDGFAGVVAAVRVRDPKWKASILQGLATGVVCGWSVRFSGDQEGHLLGRSNVVGLSKVPNIDHLSLCVNTQPAYPTWAAPFSAAAIARLRRQHIEAVEARFDGLFIRGLSDTIARPDKSYTGVCSQSWAELRERPDVKPFLGKPSAQYLRQARADREALARA